MILAFTALLQELGMNPSHRTLEFLVRRDNLRNLRRGRRILETQKEANGHLGYHSRVFPEASRQWCSRQKEGQWPLSSRKRRERFGSELPLSDEDSDTESATFNQRDCPLPTKRKKENWLVCHNCEAWFHWSCAGVKSKNGLPEYYFYPSCKTN